MTGAPIRLRGATAAAATLSNPTLAEREPGVEYDTGRLKVGDGVTEWVDLPYVDEPGVTATMSYPLTVEPGDGLILADGPITLPAADRPGQTHTIKNVSDDPLDVSAADLIDGAADFTLNPDEAVTVVATGADWVITCHYVPPLSP